MLKNEVISAIGKQDNDQFHAFQRWEIRHSQIQDEINGTIWFLDPKNIKIIILSALVKKLWPKTCFCKMAAIIMHPYLANMQTAKDLVIDQDQS